MAPKDPERVREYQREYARVNAERKRSATRQWRADNPERARESDRNNYQAHREARLETGRRWRNANREEANRKRRARAAAAGEAGGRNPFARWRNALIASLWPAQDGRCYLCGDPMNVGGKERSSVVLDHDHRCCGPNKGCRYCVRGLACSNCNLIIGMSADDPDLLETIARNLRIKLAEMEDRLAGKPQQLELGAEEAAG